jgi:hypothetical protein
VPLNKSWHEYNESLIERGRILMDIGFVRSSKSEIKNMNKGKVGDPFEYSSTYIQFLAFLKTGFKISYRTVQGKFSTCLKPKRRNVLKLVEKLNSKITLVGS